MTINEASFDNWLNIKRCAWHRAWLGAHFDVNKFYTAHSEAPKLGLQLRTSHTDQTEMVPHDLPAFGSNSM